MDVRPLSLMGSLEFVGGGACSSFLVLGTHQTGRKQGGEPTLHSKCFCLSPLKILERLKNQRNESGNEDPTLLPRISIFLSFFFLKKILINVLIVYINGLSVIFSYTHTACRVQI